MQGRQGGSGEGGLAGLKMAALNRPLYKGSFHLGGCSRGLLTGGWATPLLEKGVNLIQICPLVALCPVSNISKI